MSASILLHLEIEMNDKMPPDCCLIQAKLIRAGDTVRFRLTSYVVEGVDTDSIGNVRLRSNDDTMTHCYGPNEMLWITKRDGGLAGERNRLKGWKTTGRPER